MKNLTMKQTLAQFKKDLKVMDYDFENQTIQEIVAEWWAAQFGCNNPEQQAELIEMWQND